MPQIGSSAVIGVAASGRTARVEPPARLDDRRQDRQRDLGRRARTDVEPGRGVDALQQLLGDAVGTEHVEHRGAALAARHQPDVADARLERRPQDRELVAAVGGDDQREVIGARHRGAAVGAARVDGLESQLRCQAQERRGDRRVAGDDHPRRRQERLEEDLDRAA